MSRRLRSLLASLFLLSALIPAFAHATATGSCRWVCVGSECRVDAPDGATCDAELPQVDVLVDAPGDVCLPEPVSWEMVSDEPPVFDTDASAVPFAEPAAGSPFVGFADPVAPPAKQKILLTGFCSNDNFPNNPSGRILPALEKEVKRLCGDKVELTSKCLDITVGAIRECKVEKQIVISMGVCDDEKVRIETGAVNCFIDPFTGKPKCEVVKGGPGEITPGAPLPTLPDKIGGYPVANPPIDPTNTYVCNATYYWLCTKKECKPYFVHIPPLPSDKTKDDAFVKDMAKLICGIVDKNAPARIVAPWVIASEGDGAAPVGR